MYVKNQKRFIFKLFIVKHKKNVLTKIVININIKCYNANVLNTKTNNNIDAVFLTSFKISRFLKILFGPKPGVAHRILDPLSCKTC